MAQWGPKNACRFSLYQTLVNDVLETQTAGRLHQSVVRKFFANLGPGLVTGAADDDPSGISTYSMAGARFGYTPLWTALVSFPLMAAVQLMCARLGVATGQGLAGAVRRRYSPRVLWAACALLVIANVINVGADLGGMGEVTSMITGVTPLFWTPLYAVLIVALLFWTTYKQIAQIFKWLTLVLFAYVIAAFLAKPDWSAVLAATLVPHLSLKRDSMSVLVAILGTTISPYLLFWQAAQEVEEKKRAGSLHKDVGKKELRRVQTDVMTGMLLSNVVMYFIILTTASTLHAHGVTNIETARQAAEALRPLAGNGAYWLFALGVIGTGMLGVPVLVGSCAYALAEASLWRATLDQPPRKAPRFYSIIAIAMVLGLALNYLKINVVQMLFWTAVINGVLAPPLILLTVLLTNDSKVMGPHVNPPLLRWLGWATFVAMTVAAVGLFIT
jgi:NRAMP (natural resistance-associated macrophage protein)-like metal ion transporter